MNCMHCAGKVGAALEMVEGITKADVSHEAGTAIIETTRDVPQNELAEAISGVGYSLEEVEA